MRNVERPSQVPPSLSNSARRWEKELLQEIERCKTLSVAVPNKYYQRYKKPDIRDALEAMYQSLCCYCESRINVVGFPHIEHYRPKRKFPRHCYCWDNLHLACELCNNAKSDQFDEVHPILDSVEDVPISSHLTYEWGIDGVLRWPCTKRGAVTIGQTDLNRSGLKQTRLDVLRETFKVIISINQNQTAPDVPLRKEELRKLCKGPYGSLIEWAMEYLLVES